MKKIVASLILFLSLVPFCYAYQSPGLPQGFVNDFAGVLSAEEKTSLEEKVTTFQKETTNEIAVVAIHSLAGDSIENYANELFREWGIGTKEKNNGVLFLVAVDDHKMRIEVGYGLEGAVTDIGTKHLQEEVATPAFQNNDYYKGIDGVVDGLISMSKGEYTAPTPAQVPKNIVGILFFVFVVLSWLGAILSRSKSWWAGGVVGGIAGVLVGVFFTVAIGLVATLPLVGLGLLFDYIVSHRYSDYKSGRHSTIPWWAGGGGSGGGSGGGFGGFGGGGSGGGGSSSSW